MLYTKTTKRTAGKSVSSANKLKYKNNYLIPIIFIMALVPLIVHQKSFYSHLSKYPWFSPQDALPDIFLYNKALAFTLISIVISCILCYKVYSQKSKIKFVPTFLPLGVYAVLAIVSSLASKYSYFSYHGIYEQFESLWVILGYCLLTYYAFLFVNSEDDVKLILKWFTVSTAILCLIGVFQAFFLDFYKSTVGKMLMLPTSIWNSLDEITFNFPSGTVYMSLYNPNYVGVYVCLLAPLFITLIFCVKNKKLAACYSLITIGLIICLFGSQSRAGFVSLIVTLVFMIILFRKRVLKQWKLLTVISIVLIVTFLIISLLNHNLLFNRIKTMFQTTENSYPLSQIQTNDDNVTIVYNNQSFVIRMLKIKDNNYELTATDGEGKKLPSTPVGDGTISSVNDTRFPGFQFGLVNFGNIIGFSVKVDNHDWYFTNQTDGSYYYINAMGKTDKINNVKGVKLKINDSFANNRGYIWSRSLPLLKKSIFIGTGADTFSLFFPQNDYVGLYNVGFEGKTITRPHSLYLQIGIQTGILSLIALLVFYSMYFISSLKLYWNRHLDSYMERIGVSILAGSLSYMIAGLTNDSSITVAPLFYGLLGIGLAINYKLTTEK